MKKLLMLLCVSIFGCAAEDYSIRPSYAISDTIYVLNTTGHNPFFGPYEIDMAVINFCAEKDMRAFFISKNLYGGANGHYTAKFICVK